MQRAARPLALSKDSGVVVLGSYSPSESKEELLQVRNQIRAMGYDAQLVVDMPEFPMMSNEEKVRLWTIVARFSVMVDRVPSGHIAEYMMLKEQRSILAMVRPRGVASTSMIGDASLVDIRHIRIFEFDDTPLEALDEAVRWAEALATERAQQYDAAYRWRRSEP
jgi:hypothetical protein